MGTCDETNQEFPSEIPITQENFQSYATAETVAVIQPPLPDIPEDEPIDSNSTAAWENNILIVKRPTGILIEKVSGFHEDGPIMFQAAKCDDDKIEGEDQVYYFDHPDIDGGWAWVVLIAGVMAMAIISSVYYTFNLYFVLLMEEFETSRSDTAWIGSMFAAFLQLSGPLATILIKSFGCRKTMFIGSFVAAFGFVCSSLATSLSMLMITHGIITAMGCCFNYSAWIITLVTYFRKKHGLATGLLTSGSGLGLFCYAPLLKYIIEEYSWRGSYLIDAGLVLNFCVFAAVLYPIRQVVVPEENIDEENQDEKCHLAIPGTPQIPLKKCSLSSLYLSGSALVLSHSMTSLPSHVYGSRMNINVASDARSGNNHCEWAINSALSLDLSHKGSKFVSERVDTHPSNICSFFKNMLQKKQVVENCKDTSESTELRMAELFIEARFLSLLVTNLLWVMATNIVFIIIGDFANSRNLGEYFTYALSGIGLGDLVGRLCSGAISSSGRVNPFAIFIGSQLLCALSIFTYLFIYSGELFIALSVFFSITYGVQCLYTAVTPAQMFGAQNLNTVYGYILFACGIGCLVGGPLAGWTVDSTSDYIVAFTLAGVFQLLSVVACSICWWCTPNLK